MNDEKFYFAERNIVFYSLNDQNEINKILSLSKEAMPNLVCYFKKNNRITNIDISKWCYTKSKVIKQQQTKGNIYLAIKSTLKTDRLLGIHYLLNYLVGNNFSTTTINSLYKEINPIFIYLNDIFENLECNNVINAEYIYIEYTKYLINKINIQKSSSNVVNTEHYKTKQYAMANFLAACAGKSINYFYSKAKTIEYIRIKKIMHKNESKDDVQLKVKILLKIFNKLTDHILEDKELPCIISLEEYKLNKTYIDINLISRSQQDFLEFFYDDTSFVSYEVFKNRFDNYYKDKDKDKKSITRLKNEYKKKYFARVSKIIKLNELEFKSNRTNILMANLCMIVFAKLLISTSGANESIIYDLHIEKMKTISHTKGMRSYGTKNRAHGKKVPVEFGLKFQIIFEKYLKFRKKINDIFKNELPDNFKNLLFIKIPTEQFSSYNSFMKLDSVSFDFFNKIFKRLFNTTTITNKELRNNVGNSFFNSTNDSTLTSIKLGNTPAVASESYANSSFKEVALQLTNYFEKFSNEIIFKGRNNSEVIPVNLENENAISIPAGNCDLNVPILIAGFNNETPKPTCDNQKSCLFCSSYTIFFNKIDIKKILSLKYILEYNSEIKAEQQKVLYRIYEILNFMKSYNPNIEKLILEVLEEVEEGYLDEYWNNHLNLIISLGENSNESSGQ